MFKVGITGGIGSGKSTICRIFETLGIPVYYADDRAKQLMISSPPLVQQITQLLGPTAYLPNGQLNRVHIASIVFTDKEKLAALNALVHPAVAQDSLGWHHQQSQVPFTLKEAALLFESQSHLALDKVITVYAPEEIRIERVMKRDGVDADAVRARIRQQMSEEEKLEMADFVIHNDGQQLLIPQVMRVWKELAALVG